MSELAVLGGDPSIRVPRDDLFEWPILGREEEEAVLRTMRKPSYLDFETVPAFEKELTDWLGVEHVITESSGTHAVLGAMFACGVGAGDEVIVPTSTYWATCVQAFTLRASVVFADIDPLTMNIDPADVKRKITDRTKAIVVVHLLGYPVDMDAICAIARRHGVKVIEDASHAHGSLYKGRKVGTLGDIAAFSMCGKPLSIGEGGMIATNDTALHDRALAWGHNFRFHPGEVRDPDLLRFAGLPLGGVTSRMHNLSAAIGREQLRRFDERVEEIDAAMNLFWDLLEDVPGLVAHRPPRGSGSTMGGWYNPHGVYQPEKFNGLSVSRFVEAVRAEGFYAATRICIREPLHTHELFHSADVYREGRPTNRHASGNPPQRRGDLPVAESVKAFTVPPFRRYDKAVIEEYAAMFRKVAEHHKELIEGDRGDGSVVLDERGNG
ncbi:DegT/DnrJ/EryC1/StrS family aminotransferase [Saccharothrix syringae]|uniref:DegT/DnrJ/EryC1/StrS family aminotransferase n=1 Tax=Saccharothrix syringae TaxID=103733 RepID=A0A5Q0GZD6_SACSY|nr:DegT/DnrJ/EryC1/StrS family aminotransferase [Saccharothrix syringae]QFZ18904.1 DegT/DnrJ/EryC1/StrS family aminotransferase [Saccharothrix syringae]